MSITQKQVEHVAKLARLSLTEEEKSKFTTQLNDILQFAEKLNELDTDQVEPTSHIYPVVNVVREDTVRPSIEREKALVNAPDQKAGLFRVPAVFGE